MKTLVSASLIAVTLAHGAPDTALASDRAPSLTVATDQQTPKQPTQQAPKSTAKKVGYTIGYAAASVTMAACMFVPALMGADALIKTAKGERINQDQEIMTVSLQPHFIPFGIALAKLGLKIKNTWKKPAATQARFSQSSVKKMIAEGTSIVLASLTTILGGWHVMSYVQEENQGLRKLDAKALFGCLMFITMLIPSLFVVADSAYQVHQLRQQKKASHTQQAQEQPMQQR